MPIEPAEPTPAEPIVVTLVDVQADLWWAWDVDGSVWLLPAYRFIDTDGGWHTAPAVTDEFMIRIDPSDSDGEPVPVPEPMPVEVDPAPAPEPDAIILELDQVLPLSEAEFSERAAELGFTTRTVIQDGVTLAVTADYSESRLNVEVEGDVVVGMVSIG